MSATGGWATRLRASPTDAGGPGRILRFLYHLRTIAIISQIVGIAFVHFGLGITLPLAALAVPIGALMIWNLVNVRRVFSRVDVQPVEVAAHLIVDIAAFTGVIYLTGGAGNPFISLYLVPIALAAIALPALHAAFVGAVCIVSYTLLWQHHVPLPSVQGRFGSDFDLHLMGMWVNFVIAAVLVVVVVGRMARILRRRDRELASMREAALRDEQIVELGALAAGAAHEINTPLGTLALLIEELEESSSAIGRSPQLRTMAEQIDVISERLNRIAGSVGAARSAGARHVRLSAFIDDLVERWRDTHPDIEITTRVDLASSDMHIVAEATIEQAIQNVLDNAAHAAAASGDRRVDLVVECHATTLQISVRDTGPGLEPGLRDELGFKIHSTKERGLGIGLLLSRAALHRLGGQLEIENRDSGGVEARIRLPLDDLIADAG